MKRNSYASNTIQLLYYVRFNKSIYILKHSSSTRGDMQDMTFELQSMTTIKTVVFAEGGGWTVLQRRGDYGSPDDFFLKKWVDYKGGFGDPSKVRFSL